MTRDGRPALLRPIVSLGHWILEDKTTVGATSMSTGPTSVITAFERGPLRELVWSRLAGSCLA